MDLLVKDHSKRGIDWEQIHCCDETLEMAKNGADVHTTLRNPYHVAISWANRGRIGLSPRIDKKWFYQWEKWAEIAPYATIHPVKDLQTRSNSKSDDLGLYDALENDLDKFYQHVPKEWVDHALNLTVEVQRAKSVETRK